MEVVSSPRLASHHRYTNYEQFVDLLTGRGNYAGQKMHPELLKVLTLTRKWIKRVEHVSDTFNSPHIQWKGGEGEKYNLKWRTGEDGKLTMKSEQKVTIPIMNLMTILQEDKYYIDWVRFLTLALTLDPGLQLDAHERPAIPGYQNLQRGLRLSNDEEKRNLVDWAWLEQIPRG